MLCATNPCSEPDTLLSSHHRGVTFAIVLWWCRHRHHIVPVGVLPLPLCHCGVTFAIASSQGRLRCHVITVLTSPLWCCLHHCVVAVLPLWGQLFDLSACQHNKKST